MRINIYIPAKLWEEMNKRKDINWSEIAQKAFEDRLKYKPVKIEIKEG